jgi:transposase
VLTLPPSVRIWVATEAVDMRRGHDGLCAIVRNHWKLDLFAGHLFVFLGKRQDRCKIVFWDRGGFVLYYKRLEKGRFRVPKRSQDGHHVELDSTALTMLLDGIDVRRVPRATHWEPPTHDSA